MAEEALKPRTTMQQWIDSAVFAGDLMARKNRNTSNTKAIQAVSPSSSTVQPVYSLTNGWLCKDGNVLVGGKAPDGGRYATVGSADAIFTIPRETMKLLSLSLLRK